MLIRLTLTHSDLSAARHDTGVAPASRLHRGGHLALASGTSRGASRVAAAWRPCVPEAPPGRNLAHTPARSLGRSLGRSPGRIQDRIQDHNPGRTQGRIQGRIQGRSPGPEGSPREA